MNIRYYKLIITLALLLPQMILAGNMQLEVIPLKSRVVSDVIQVIHPLITPGGTVTGILGEWMELGGISQNHDQSSRQFFSTFNASGQELRTILIKVDEIR